MKSKLYNTEYYTTLQKDLMDKNIRDMLSHQPSPYLINKRYLSSIENKNKLLFAIIKSNTKKDNKAASFLCIDLESNKIINHEFDKGLNNVKNFKTFIASTIVMKSEVISKVFIPKIAESVNLQKFIDINKNVRDVEYYIHKSLTEYNNIFLDLRKNFIKNNIEDKSMLLNFVINYNNKYKSQNILKVANKGNKGIRNYSTVATPVTQPEAPILPTVKDTKFRWLTYTSNVEYPVITYEVFENEFLRFLEYYKKNFNIPHLSVLPKIMVDENIIRTITIMEHLNVNDPSKVLTVYKFYLTNDDILSNLSFDDHESFESKFPRGKILFNFKTLIDTEIIDKHLNSQTQEIKVIKTNVKDIKKVLNFRSIDLLPTMDLHRYKGINFHNDYQSAIFKINVKNKDKNNIINCLVMISEKSYTITLLLDNHELFTVVDTKDGNSSNLFKREYFIKNELKLTNFYIDEELVSSCKPIKTGYIKKLKSDNKLNLDKVCTLDIETKKDCKTGVLTPICMSFYINKKTYSFHFTDDWENEMVAAFKTILKRKYRGLKFYIHNFSKFDYVFILDILSRIGEVDILKNNTSILKLELTFKSMNSNYKFTFYDSYLLLPSSLKSLSNTFKVNNKKILFPVLYSVENENFDINYIGAVPSLIYFPKNTSKKEYKKYCKNYKNNFNYKNELIKYCEMDCIALHDIVCSFATFIFNLNKVDITNSYTIPSIALKDFRVNFLEENNVINITDSKLNEVLRSAYYGGYCDIFKGHGKNIHSYDVISQYPSVMYKYPMPVNSITHVVGDPNLFVENSFGYYRVNVKAPDNLHIPILPFRVNKNGGTRTIYPTGTWSGVYFSEEIKNAEKYGYKFEIIEAWLMEKQVIFKEYMEQKFNIKKKFSKNDPMYYIAKLLMNGLYGRLGMDFNYQFSCVVTPEESEKYMSKYKIIDLVPLRSGNVLITYTDQSKNINFNTSVIVSAAVTAYARIEMSKFLIKYPHDIYAIDTDGIKMDKKLDSEFLSNDKLGMMKYEYTFDEAAFIAPKVYGGILTDNNIKSEIVKVKGFKGIADYKDLKSLLQKDNFKIYNQDKFHREISLSCIIIKKTPYKLKISTTKRVIIFDDSNKFVTTLPIKLDNGKIVGELSNKKL